MVGRYEISDNGWAQIEDIVAPPQTMGRPRRDDRKMLNGIFWMLCSGAKWRDNGVIYLSVMALGRRFMIGSASGVMTAPLKRYFLACSSNYVKMG